jgi:hypothetical protein
MESSTTPTAIIATTTASSKWSRARNGPGSPKRRSARWHSRLYAPFPRIPSLIRRPRRAAKIAKRCCSTRPPKAEGEAGARQQAAMPGVSGCVADQQRRRCHRRGWRLWIVGRQRRTCVHAGSTGSKALGNSSFGDGPRCQTRIRRRTAGWERSNENSIFSGTPNLKRLRLRSQRSELQTMRRSRRPVS